MFGSYIAMIDGPDEHHVFEVVFNDDLSVEYNLLNSKKITSEVAEYNRAHRPPHTHVSKVAKANGVHVQTEYATVVGFDWNLLENERHEELFSAIINYVDNHSIIFLETKAEAEEFIRDNCPR